MLDIKNIFLLSIIWVLLHSSCTAVNQGRTIGAGRVAMETSLGGPLMTNLGFPFPIPNLFVGGRYGLRDDFDLAGHINLLTPIIPGIALDLLTSADWVPVQPGIGVQKSSPRHGWGAGLGLDIQWLTDFKNGFVILPAVDLCGSYRFNWISFFAGSGFGFNFLRPGDHDNPFQICPFAGLELISRKQVSFGIKLTAFDVFYNFNGSQTEWIYLIDKTIERKKYAPLGVSVGLGYTFKKK